MGLGTVGKLGDITAMSRQPLPVTPRQIAALPPEFRTPPRGD
jgi:hypothetical protein